jgi:hypothetical protein
MGIHRHVVRTVAYDDRLYHLKELPRRYADREWRFLRYLREEQVPVVDVVGVVSLRDAPDGERLDAVLITEHLEFSVPYRLLFLRQEHQTIREPMLDALVHLLVRIHLQGFYWGDCSLSNTLFRRDAGHLAAYLVDTETGELYEELSAGQRDMDVELAIEKSAGELLDLQAAGVLSEEVDPFDLGLELRERYDQLWAELTRDEVFGDDERYRIYERLRRINELGYDVDELELVQDEPGMTRMKLKTSVVEPGRYRTDPPSAHRASTSRTTRPDASSTTSTTSGRGSSRTRDAPCRRRSSPTAGWSAPSSRSWRSSPRSCAGGASPRRSSTRSSTCGTGGRRRRGPTWACSTPPTATWRRSWR